MNNKNQFLSTSLKAQKCGYKPATGRNNQGRITIWHRGGQNKKLYRLIDFYRRNTNGIIVGFEYDPNRAAFLARIFNPDVQKNNYILACTRMKIGDVIRSDSEQTVNGHSQKLRYVPTGTLICNFGKTSTDSSKFARAPGCFGVLINKTNTSATIKLKSGKKYKTSIETMATIGIISNSDQKYKKKTKAGQTRWQGRRPTVRGVAMNPVDHPHGGGEGKTSGGRPSVTPWGQPKKKS